MLRAPKVSVLREVPPTHETLFVEHYELLHQWALRFTKRDIELAEDLLHDTYINFTLMRPDLENIENLQGYLYIVMRNLHLSQLRKATRTPVRSMSVVEFDTADVGFWASDPRDRMRMRDELGVVCQFVCIRKETSKGGSILILRFFHGYYPEEIARVLRTTRAVIHERMRRTRAEVRTYMEDPKKLSFIGDNPPKAATLNVNDPGGDLRYEMRRQIFDSCQGEHTTTELLNRFYRAQDGEVPECRTLAHIASCGSCLDNVNSLLGLPLLASRYPLDTLGNDPGPNDRFGGGDDGGTSGGGIGGSKVLDTLRYRRDTHYHHEPQELCISVNGQLQGFQKVVSGKGELTLMLDTAEALGFIEIFSEQGLRLLMLNVEPPPVGDGMQTAHVNLSSGRTVDVDLNFSGPFPALQVKYHDPELVAAAASAIETTAAPDEESVQPLSIGVESQKPGRGSLFDGFGFWLQPARLTAAFAALLILSLIFFKFGPVGTVSAAELLNQSAEAEATQLANKERVLHRTIDLEEYASDGQITSRKRIDVWQSAERGITARRLYDEQGRLAMGDWRSANGIQTLYKRGEPAKLQPLPVNRTKTITFDDAWQLSISAGEFKALLGVGDDAQLQERDTDYLISYARLSSPPARGGVDAASADGVVGDGITKAAIVLSKEDLHAIEQTFTLRYGGETRDYRLTEAAYEWRPSNAVAPAVFEPNGELTGGTETAKSTTRKIDTTIEANTNAATDANGTTAPAAAIATAALEVEVVEALNNAGAFMGEQIGVSRTQDGKILVTGLVETADRKKALLTALSGVANNPAIRIRIETVAEAESRIKKQSLKGGQPAQPGTVEQIEVTEGMSPVYAELKKRFSDDEARRFADTILNRSKQARLHALAAKQLASRFSVTDLQTLTPTERARWISLIRGHADSFLRETESLRRDLQQFFPDANTGATGGGAITSDAELQARTRELYEAAVSLDRGLGRSFALTSGQSGTAPVKGSSFWRSFANAMSIAKSLQSAK